LRYREDILDNMGSDELIANLFRISQTEQKLKKDNIQSEKEANKAHYEVGSNKRSNCTEGEIERVGSDRKRYWKIL